MCGIVGYFGKKQASSVILDALTRLEYRGYDSAGIAVLQGKTLKISRSLGKLSVLKNKVAGENLQGHIGIGHTRWATHGKPSEINAHPHQAGSIVLVHNGIIENYAELKTKLQKQGRKFSSETDTEVLAHWVDAHYGKKTSLLEAVRKALTKVRGSFAIAVLSLREPEQLVAARLGSPLIAGIGDGEYFLASDTPAILPYTRKAVYLPDASLLQVQATGIALFDLNGKALHYQVSEVEWDVSQAQKGGYPHFMLKEIFEQSVSITDTLTGRLLLSKNQVQLAELDKILKNKSWLKQVKQIYLIACGTSWHAAHVAKFYLEKFFKVPVLVDYASEFRYRDFKLNKNTLMIPISQSGETADTLTATQMAKKQGAKIIAICNVLGSSLTREAHATLYTRCGPEIGVAATKTFTAQILALLLLALKLGLVSQKIKGKELAPLLRALQLLPNKIKMVLENAEAIKNVALQVLGSHHYLFVGRGISYPVALEGALKLKEISYVHAEGYAAGELKHGPIALLEDNFPVVALVSKQGLYEKMISNIQEVKSRGAWVIAIASKGDKHIGEHAQAVLALPQTDPLLVPLLEAIPIQLFAYYIAAEKGLDVDQPRNLAKSVTVE